MLSRKFICAAAAFLLISPLFADNKGNAEPAQSPAIRAEEASASYSLRCSLIPEIALAFPVTLETRKGGRVWKTTRGAIGAQLCGEPRNDFLAGWANAFLLELYRDKAFYGIFTGWSCFIDHGGGILVSVLLNEPSAFAGIQIAGIGNSIGQHGAGLQIAPLRNAAAGYQGMQIALWNSICDTSSPSGVMQIGVVNTAKSARSASFQIGLFNTSDGGVLQIGLLNHAENAWIPWIPFLNFSSVPDRKSVIAPARTSSESGAAAEKISSATATTP